MRRSQEQPVKNATAAGGKRIVTCERDKYCAVGLTGWGTDEDEEDVRSANHVGVYRKWSRGGVQGGLGLRQAVHKQR